MAALGKLVTKPNRTCSIAAMALCFMLTACNRPTESANDPPSADSFHVELFEVRVGQAIENVNGAAVTSAFFREAKVLPLLGREFLDEEYQTASARVMVMAASLWQRQFGGDPALIGKSLHINEQQYTVVGILPKTFQFPTGAELWIPQDR
jgi:hypothetical protein